MYRKSQLERMRCQHYTQFNNNLWVTFWPHRAGAGVVVEGVSEPPKRRGLVELSDMNLVMRGTTSKKLQNVYDEYLRRLVLILILVIIWTYDDDVDIRT